MNNLQNIFFLKFLLILFYFPSIFISQNLVFIDDNLPSKYLITEKVSSKFETIIVSEFKEICYYLEKYKQIESVSIISHGFSGSILLGNNKIDNDFLDNNELLLKSFIKVDNLLLYGCNIAKGISGKNFINTFKTFVKGNIYASNNLTGQLGDWQLEYSTSEISIKKTPFKTINLNYPYNLQRRFLLIHENITAFSYNVIYNKWLTAINNNCAVYDQILINRNITPDTALNIFNNPISNTYFDGGIIIASIPNTAPSGSFSPGGVFASATTLQINNLYNYINNGGSVYIQTEYNWRNLEIVDDLMDEMGVINFLWGGISMLNSLTISPPFESSYVVLSAGPHAGAASNYVSSIIPGINGNYCSMAYNTNNEDIGFVYSNGNGALFTFSDMNFWSSGANSTLVKQGFLDNIVYLMLNPSLSCTGGGSQNIPQTYICSGDSIFFNQVYYNTTGSYQGLITNTLGCDSVIYLNLIVNQCIDSTSLSICYGDSALLFGIWQINSGIYIDTLLNINGLDSIVLVNLFILPQAINTLSADICQGDSILLNGVYWHNPGNYYDTIPNGSINTCDSIVQINVTVFDKPVLVSNYDNDSCQQAVGFIDIDVLIGLQPYSYYWNNNEITDSIFGLTAGTYIITVTDNEGCIKSDTIIIEDDLLLCGGSLWLPNIFSPNNDLLNDVLYVRGAEGSLTFEFIIYNRWGQKVYYSTDPAAGWDGTFDGKILNDAVFAYLVTVTFLDGTDAVLSGTITLVK